MVHRLAPAALILVAGCAAFYAASPRYGRAVHPGFPVAPKRPAPSTPVTDKRQGKLGWPAVGTLCARFGLRIDSLYGTKTRVQGIDITCSRGAPARAAYEGRVSFAERFMGYGKMVILDHGERLHSVYSRLDSIAVAVGARVSPGQVVGFVSDTLHFEVRKEGKSVDPLEWLEPRK